MTLRAINSRLLCKAPSLALESQDQQTPKSRCKIQVLQFADVLGGWISPYIPNAARLSAFPGGKLMFCVSRWCVICRVVYCVLGLIIAAIRGPALKALGRLSVDLGGIWIRPVLCSRPPSFTAGGSSRSSGCSAVQLARELASAGPAQKSCPRPWVVTQPAPDFWSSLITLGFEMHGAVSFSGTRNKPFVPSPLAVCKRFLVLGQFV